MHVSHCAATFTITITCLCSTPLVAIPLHHQQLRNPPYTVTTVLPLADETVADLFVVSRHGCHEDIVRCVRQTLQPQPFASSMYPVAYTRESVNSFLRCHCREKYQAWPKTSLCGERFCSIPRSTVRNDLHKCLAGCRSPCFLV